MEETSMRELPGLNEEEGGLCKGVSIGHQDA